MNAPLKPGFNGQPPEYMETRDLLSRDRLTGAIVREKVDGPTNVNNTRLRWMFEHKQISDRQYAAGERFATDWEKAQICPFVSANLTGVGGGRNAADLHPSEAKEAAMKRHGAAEKALGRWLGVVNLVAIEGKTITEAAVMIGNIHKERCSERLQTGLDILADHYGIGR